MATRQQALGMFALVALAFALSTLTALRLPGVPVGLAELVMLCCIISHVPLGFGIYGGNSPNRFVPFLFLMFVAMLPGYFVTLASDGYAPFALYNLIASAWVLLLFTYIHFGFDYRSMELDRMVRMFVAFSSLYFIIVLLLAMVEPSLVYRPDDLASLLAADQNLDEDPVLRLVGFAANPNQLGLHALVVLFFALQLKSGSRFMVTAACVTAAATTGYMAQSDAFLFAAIALVGVSVVMGIVFNKSVITGLIVLVPAAVVGFLLMGTIAGEIQEIANTRDQNLTRLTLWGNGLEAGLERPLIGLGPGAWSGLDGPRGEEEAHNTPIDYFSNAGLLGAALLFVGLAVIFLKTLVARQPVLLAGLVAVTIFALFHNVLRQPILWLVFYYVAQKVWESKSEQAGGRQRRPRRRSRRLRQGSSRVAT